VKGASCRGKTLTCHVLISAFYDPFRDALASTPQPAGNGD